MADTLAPVNLFRRLTFVLIAVVGLIFLIVGGRLLAGQSWDRVEGDNAMPATPVWVGVGSAGLGILLVVVAFVMMRRARKAV